MAPTKTTAEVDAWAEIAQAGSRLGAETDVSGANSAMLHIKMALSNTTAHTGTEAIVQVGSDTGNGNDNWETIARLIGPIGTAVSLSLDATEPIGETAIAVTNPVTANMDNDGKSKFIEHGTPANSEIVYQSANSGDAGDTITILKGLGHEQTSSSTIFDIDDAVTEAVLQVSVEIPPDADRVRVIYNNNYDPDGATVFTSARLTTTTSLG